MASNTMTPERLSAGADYLAALRKFGLEPDVLAWVYRREQDDFALLLISALVDRIGPLPIYDILFKAYDAAVTPQSIDPWIVDLHGRGTILAESLFSIAKPLKDGTWEKYTSEGKLVPKSGDDLVDLVIGFNVRPSWIYVAKAKPPAALAQIRNWDRFASIVERAAA